MYHNPFMTKYLLGVKVKDVFSKSADNFEFEKAFQKLIGDINEDLMVNKKAFLLSCLLKMLESNLPEGENNAGCIAFKL